MSEMSGKTYMAPKLGTPEWLEAKMRDEQRQRVYDAKINLLNADLVKQEKEIFEPKCFGQMTGRRAFYRVYGTWPTDGLLETADASHYRGDQDECDEALDEAITRVEQRFEKIIGEMKQVMACRDCKYFFRCAVLSGKFRGVSNAGD